MPRLDLTTKELRLFPDETRGGFVLMTGFSDFSDGSCTRRLLRDPNRNRYGEAPTLVPIVDRGINLNDSGMVRRFIHEPGIYSCTSFIGGVALVQEIEFEVEVKDGTGFRLSLTKVPYGAKLYVHHQDGSVEERATTPIIPLIVEFSVLKGSPELEDLKARTFDNSQVIKYEDRISSNQPNRFDRIRDWDDE